MKKRPRDPAQLMIDIASGEVENKISARNTPASEFARQGGLKGGRARADKPNNVTKPRRILRGYAAYYNVSRTDRSLNKDAPLHRAIECLGAVISAFTINIAESNFRLTQPIHVILSAWRKGGRLLPCSRTPGAHRHCRNGR